MRRGRVVAVVSFGLLLCTALSHAQDDAFVAHLKDAEQNEQSAAGKLYEPAFQKAFGGGYAPRLSQCAKQAGGPQSQPFDVLVKLASSGTVEEAMVRPKTAFSECFMELSKKAAFPKPPSSGYWVVARMRFSQ